MSWFTRLFKRHTMPVLPDTEGSAFREQIVKEARKLWLNPPDLEVIRDDKGWHTSQPDWCGEFAGLAAGRAGLAQAIRYFCTPSTYRLQSAEKWEEAGYPQPDVPAKGALVKGKARYRGHVQRGDLICVVTGERKSYGDHIEIVELVVGDKIYTYGGNTTGLLPDGSQSSPRRAIVRQVRRIEDVRQIIRFDDRHRE